MTNKELTELMIKQLLHEWKREKSITTAYDICNTLCEYYNINGKDNNETYKQKRRKNDSRKQNGFMVKVRERKPEKRDCLS